MPDFPNFHVTVNTSIDEVPEISREFDHYCLLFAGRLNYFGAEPWEQHALTRYIRFAEQCKNKNIKITCKFIVYETDEAISGHNCNRLTGFGNIYQSLFTTIENSLDVEYMFYPWHDPDGKIFDHNDKEKYLDVESWLENNLYDCQLKKVEFEEYCKCVFDIMDDIQFYYVDSNKEVLTRIQTTLNNPDINSVYGFGQHFQVGTAYRNYPNMFDDCDTNTIVIKVRYDGVYFSATEHFNFTNAVDIGPGLFKDVFYSMDDNVVIRNFFLVGEHLKREKFNIYQLPTVMYVRQRADLKEHIHSFPHDISLIFNKEGVVHYAKHYTDYILNKALQTHDINDKIAIKTNQYLGLHIHASLGDFFKNNNFNQLDYTSYRFNNCPVNVFGATLREMRLPPNKLAVTDIYDDYKLRWYNGYWAILSEITEKFGKNDNT